MIRKAGVEAPEQIGGIDQPSEMFKKMMSKVIRDTHGSGRESMDMFLSECLNDANEMTRHGGFARAQWVLSSLPRSPATTCEEMWVFFEHVVMDREPMVHSLVTEQSM